MTMKFHYLSGSPFSWKIWLALEHGGFAYEPVRLQVDAGDLRSAEFLALNPKGKLPVLVDGALVLSESDAIAEYLADLPAPSSAPLWPGDIAQRALGRRFAAAATNYVYPQVRRIMEQTLFLKAGAADLEAIGTARTQLSIDLRLLEEAMQGDFATGSTPTIADFTLYPFIALLGRIDAQKPGHFAAAVVPERLATWARRIEDLPWFERTIPPHWRAQ
jgi:glutathione S-transferase